MPQDVSGSLLCTILEQLTLFHPESKLQQVRLVKCAPDTRNPPRSAITYAATAYVDGVFAYSSPPAGEFKMPDDAIGALHREVVLGHLTRDAKGRGLTR